jgi:hypothetical protein
MRLYINTNRHPHTRINLSHFSISLCTMLLTIFLGELLSLLIANPKMCGDGCADFCSNFLCGVNKKKTFCSQGLKYISVAFANDKVTPKNHSYKNIDATHYINCSDGNPYTTQPGGKGVVNPAAHLNSKGYVRHSGFQNTVVDSCNTEAFC